MSKVRAGPAVGWAYLVCVIDSWTREITGWNLSLSCRSEEAIDAIEQSVLTRSPRGSREARLTLTTDNGTQFTSMRFLEPASRLGITHRRTAYRHPEGNSYIDTAANTDLGQLSAERIMRAGIPRPEGRQGAWLNPPVKQTMYVM
jgi:transposase InsO family protein